MTSSLPPNPSNTDPNDALVDARIDGALRAAAQGGGTRLPAAPTPEQIRRWEGGAMRLHGAGTRLRAGGRRWFAGLSAAAAMMAIGAVAIFTLPLSRPVQASTILSSLRSASVSGFKVSIIGLESRGVTVNGEMQIHFPESFPVERILDEDADQTLPEPSEAAMSIDVAMDDDGPVPGLRAQAQGALSSQSSWFYARSTPIPQDRMKGVPPVALMVAGLLSNGMMMDFGAGVPAQLHEEHREHVRAMHAEAPGDEMHAKIREHFAERAARAKVRHAKQADDGQNGQKGAKDADGDGGMAQVIPLLRAVLSGQAGAGELEGIRQLLQQEAAGATVEALGDGRYMLSAAGQDDAGHHGLMRVSYAQGTGVEWVEFSKLEGFLGTVRIEFLNTPIDPAKLDKKRLIEEGKTVMISQEMIQQWLPMLVPGAGPGGEPGDDAE